MAWDRVQENWKRVSGTAKQALGHLARSGYEALRGNHLSPEREKTDESLRTERAKTDEAVAAKQADIASRADAVVDLARETADQVLSVARENADAVLDTARNKADEKLDPDASPAAPADAVAEERIVADETLHRERDDADEILRQESEKYVRSLRRFLVIERDSTDRYLLSERIRSDDALANRDDFLAIVTHDLRDLIGGVVMSTALISEAAAKTEDGKAILAEAKRIERHAARMNRLIGDLMDVASIDAGKLRVAPATGDLALLVAEVVDTFAAAASAKGVSLATRIDAAPLVAAFDHDRILQVLANLISNSLKFTPEGGKVTIRGEREAGAVRLAVLDTGSGIPEDALERIFERFSQVGKNDRRGLGLGLYISRCVVEAHGGRIWAQRPPAGGSEICFTLPAEPSRIQ
jgi:signal transduction histidine kinase